MADKGASSPTARHFDPPMAARGQASGGFATTRFERGCSRRRPVGHRPLHWADRQGGSRANSTLPPLTAGRTRRPKPNQALPVGMCLSEHSCGRYRAPAGSARGGARANLEPNMASLTSSDNYSPQQDA